MRPHAIRNCLFTFALLLIGRQVVAAEAGSLPATTMDAMAQAASPQAIAEYRRKFAEYRAARAAFEQEADAYWNSIAEKRRGRNAKRRERVQIEPDDYVLTQPPVYAGPPRPVNPEPSAPEPQEPANDLEFKRAYALTAAAAGLTREQAVRVYAFETGGNGTHASQSGFHGTRAISTAIGYNQLLTTNTVELLAEQGPEFVKELT